MIAKNVMTTAVFDVSPASSLKQAIRLMTDKDISGLPVTDDGGHICGMLTEGDILRRSEFGNNIGLMPGDPGFFERYVKAHGLTVADCMSRDVIHASPEATIRELVALMSFHHVKRIPIMRDGVLVGIVSRHDLMKAAWTKADTVAPGDGALRLAVETRLKSELGLGADFYVQVHASVVTITGQIASEAQREAIRVVTESIEGARAVVATPEHPQGTVATN